MNRADKTLEAHGKGDHLYMNTTALAFIGDAVYELYVRQRVVESGQVRGDKLHFQAVRHVKAESQAAVIKDLLMDLSEELSCDLGITSQT